MVFPFSFALPEGHWHFFLAFTTFKTWIFSLLPRGGAGAGDVKRQARKMGMRGGSM